MINLFEYFDHNSVELYHTLKLAGRNHPTVVIFDDGFLPEDATSPYQFFSEFKRLSSDRPTYFNEIDLPRFYEIESNNDVGLIKDMGILRGRIHYRKNFGNRIVERVDWLDDKFRIRKSNHYCAQGFIFAESVYDENEKLIMKHYLDRNGKVIIYHNFITNDFVLTWKKQDYFFNSILDFVMFYLEKSKLFTNSFIFNSLSLPYSVSYHTKKAGRDYLFWQEQIHHEIPGNMKLIFNNNRPRNVKIAIPDRNEYHLLKEKISRKEHQFLVKSGYIYKYLKESNHTKNILTVTNSDQLNHIEEIVANCPEFIFHIAAITEMSSKLLSLSRYNNVRLYPRSSMSVLRNLYKTSDFYLDINEGGEIVNAVRSAFDYNMVIIGYRETAHNLRFTDPVNIYNKSDYELIIEKLNSLTSEQKIDRLLQGQKQHANETDIVSFNKLFK